jgi:biotin synthase
MRCAPSPPSGWRCLGTRDGLLGGINAVIVGNYLTTLGRPATADLELLQDLKMPVKSLSATF